MVSCMFISAPRPTPLTPEVLFFLPETRGPVVVPRGPARGRQDLAAHPALRDQLSDLQTLGVTGKEHDPRGRGRR